MATVNPGVYFKELMPQYARAAKICELVYSNISRIFKPEFDAGGTVATIITLGGDFDVIRCRCLLGYYKPTIGGTAEDVKQALIDFNKLLKDNSIYPNDFSGGELSDAEHFFASAVITMVPILGLVANPVANVAWDFLLPAAKSINKNVQKSLRLDQEWGEFANEFEKDMSYDVNQLVGPDLAGHRYGMYLTYTSKAGWYYEKAKSYLLD